MATLTHHGRPRVGIWERTHVARSKGAATGTILVLLGLWGGLVPFVGPYFGYAFTPDRPWAWTDGRLWLEVLPAVAAVIGGLMVLSSSNRLVGLAGGWLAAAAGLWFVVGRDLSMLWNASGVPGGGAPVGSNQAWIVAEQLGFFYGLGALIVLAAGLALGRMSVIGVRDLRPIEEPETFERDETAGSDGRYDERYDTAYGENTAYAERAPEDARDVPRSRHAREED